MRGWPAWTAILQYVIVWATVTTTYIMAVKNGDEPRWLPTISNTGTRLDYRLVWFLLSIRRHAPSVGHLLTRHGARICAATL